MGNTNDVAHDGVACRLCYIESGVVRCPTAPHPWHDACGKYGPHPHSAEVCRPRA